MVVLMPLYLLGTKNDSRIEYAKLPGRQRDGFDLTITFRTFDKHGGLIFYAAAERTPDQFLTLYMKDAKVSFFPSTSQILTQVTVHYFRSPGSRGLVSRAHTSDFSELPVCGEENHCEGTCIPDFT